MKNFKTLLAEVDEPKSGDEKAFKAKHLVRIQKHPVANDSQFTGDVDGSDYKRNKRKRKADYIDDEDRIVYEDMNEIADGSQEFSIYKTKHGKYGFSQKSNGTWWDHSWNRQKYHDTPEEAEAHLRKSWGKQVGKVTRSFKEETDSDLEQIAAKRKRAQINLNIIDEAFSLDKHNPIYHDSHSENFAKEFAKAHKGDYKSDGPSEKDHQQNEKFHQKYERTHLKSGFAGSGEALYTHRQTGEKYHVHSQSNGKGFYGTDHRIIKLQDGITESHFSLGDKVQCIDSGMEGEIIKLDKEHGSEDEKYYTVKRDDGKIVKYAPDELKLLKEEVELDEISDELKKRYHEKGREDVYDRFTGRGKYEKPKNPDHYTKTGRVKKGILDRPEAIKYREKIASRNKYLNKVANDLTKEEMELDESGMNIVNEQINTTTLKNLHREFQNYKNTPTQTVLKRHKELRRVSSNYSAQEVGGKLAMVGDLLRNRYGDKHVTHYFNMAKKDVSKLAEETDQLDEISNNKLDSYLSGARKSKNTAGEELKRQSLKMSLGYRRSPSEIEKGNTASDTYNKRSHGIYTALKQIARKKNEGTDDTLKTKDIDTVADNDVKKSVIRKYGALNRNLGENLQENFKSGSIKLNDGSSVLLKDGDAKLLNQMFQDLNSENKKKMMKVAMTDKAGFNEILGFAREAL
jgi:hypothetical protein